MLVQSNMQQLEGFRTHVTPAVQNRRAKMVTMQHIPELNDLRYQTHENLRSWTENQAEQKLYGLIVYIWLLSSETYFHVKKSKIIWFCSFKESYELK